MAIMAVLIGITFYIAIEEFKIETMVEHLGMVEISLFMIRT